MEERERERLEEEVREARRRTNEALQVLLEQMKALVEEMERLSGMLGQVSK